MKKITDFLTANPVFHFATVEGDQPRLRPFGFFLEANERIYFFTGEHKKVFRQLLANPKFEICACNDKGEWLRLAGKAVFDTRPELVEKAFGMAPMLRDIYGAANSPKAAMFYAGDAEATFTDITGKSETVRL